MTELEILQKAIVEAEKKDENFDYSDSIGGLLDGEINTSLTSMILLNSLNIIFSKEFAKAFWGDKNPKCDECIHTVEGETNCYNHCPSNWQNHLQKMVLSENPIKYLEKFVFSLLRTLITLKNVNI